METGWGCRWYGDIGTGGMRMAMGEGGGRMETDWAGMGWGQDGDGMGTA